jgi:hypothetical protein
LISDILRNLMAKNYYSILLKSPMAKGRQLTGHLIDINGHAFQICMRSGVGTPGRTNASLIAHR